jgi:proline iminopeptidase
MKVRLSILYVVVLVASVLTACTVYAPKGTTTDDDSETQEFSIETVDVTLHARRVGSPGSLLVAVHGGPGITSHYMETLPNLTGGVLAGPKRAFVTYDQRGAGRSTQPHSKDFSFPRYVEDLDAVGTFFGADKMHLLAHSWGAAVSMAYAIAHPDRVGSLVLLGGVPPSFDDVVAGFARQAERVAELQELGKIPHPLPSPDLENDNMDALIAAMWPVYFSNPDFVPTPELAGQTMSPSNYQAAFAAQTPYDMTAELETLELPVLIVYGEDDPYGVEWARATEAAFASADVRLVIVPGCGHFYHECWGETRAALEPFLDEVAGPKE